LRELCRSAGIDPLVYALTGGEDYELLFTLSPPEFSRLRERWADEFDEPLSQIGEITGASQEVHIVSPDGIEQPVNVRSFDHFAQ
jgi:thiamine-monophosphate kinase